MVAKATFQPVFFETRDCTSASLRQQAVSGRYVAWHVSCFALNEQENLRWPM